MGEKEPTIVKSKNVKGQISGPRQKASIKKNVFIEGCPEVPTVRFANRSPSGNDRSIGAVVTYTCNSNYYFNLNTQTRTARTECMSNKRWTPTLPSACVRE